MFRKPPQKPCKHDQRSWEVQEDDSGELNIYLNCIEGCGDELARHTLQKWDMEPEDTP